jgi:hypothetical protein
MSSPPPVSPLLAASKLADAQALLDRLHFTPGPCSTKREYSVIRYIEWYLRQISRGGAS